MNQTATRPETKTVSLARVFSLEYSARFSFYICSEGNPCKRLATNKDVLD